MAYIRNFRGSSGNRAIISGSNVQVTGSLFASTVSGTAAQFNSVTASLGSITAPSYTFSGDTNTGIYSPAADTIAFVEGGAEALRISSNSAITASGDMLVNGQFFAGSGTATNPAYCFSSQTGSGMYVDSLFGTLYFAINGVRRVTIGQTAGSSIDINDQNISFSNGRGISFASTTPDGTSPTAELLDDYEEGTFTPVLVGLTTTGTGTYTAQLGRYTKVGRLVTYTINIIWTAHTGTGEMRINSLPFTSANVTNTNYVGSFYLTGVPLNNQNFLTCYIAPNSTQVILRQQSQATAAGTITINSSGTIFITGIYYV